MMSNFVQTDNFFKCDDTPIGSTIYPPLPEFTKGLQTQVVGCQGDFICNNDTIGARWCPTSPV